MFFTPGPLFDSRANKLLGYEVRLPLPVDAQPFAASPDEVAGVVWLSVAAAFADPNCPPWAQRSLRQAAAR